MTKTLLVLRHEFLRHVTRRSFLFAVLGFPLLMVLIFGGIVLFLNSQEDEPVGVVDEAGLVLDPADYQELGERDSVPFRLFGDEATAAAALEGGDIQAYAVIPADYLASGRVTLFHQGDTFEGISSDITAYLRASLLAGSEPAFSQRFGRSLDVEFVSLAEERGRDNPLALFLPFILGFIFLIAIFSTSGMLIQAIVDEKENRTMEILVTSLTPEQLMMGKIIGLVGLGFVQIAAWLGFAFIGILVARANIAGFPNLVIPTSSILVAVAWFVPFYVMIAALMAAIGISVTAVSEAQQAVGIVSIVAMFPLYFTFLILTSPDSALSITLSFIPFSAPLTILTRLQVSDVPAWQLLLSWALLATAATLALFLVSRLLRYGMLRYGQRVSLREALTLISPRRSASQPPNAA